MLAKLRSVPARQVGIIGLVVATGLAGWVIWVNLQLYSRRELLLTKPNPLPVWIWSIYPLPGAEVNAENYSQADDIYFSSTGDICVQLDQQALQMKEADAVNIHLSLNGGLVRALSFGQLLHGLWPVKGLISFNASRRVPGGLNKCWEIDSLGPSEYIGTLVVQSATGPDLTYEWAFRLLNPK